MQRECQDVPEKNYFSAIAYIPLHSVLTFLCICDIIFTSIFLNVYFREGDYMIIKVFSDKSKLEYDKGSFDDWCVYYTNAAGIRKPPKDTDYFEFLLNLAKEYTVEKVYRDYVQVYNWTGKQPSQEVLNSISTLSASYGENALAVDVVFTILYMAMIAEERKAYTKLGKRIKRLGIHALLIENVPVNNAANFMRGMGWREIDNLCRQRGF